MKRSEMQSGEPACSALIGYKAAAKIVERLLDDAGRRKPARSSYRMQRLAAYRQGYYDGLLAAHCLNALGEYPEHNQAAINDIRQQRKNK